MKPRKGIIKKSEVKEAEVAVRKQIGVKIREMRDKLHLSAHTVADKLKVSREALTHIETGRNNISAVFIWKLATLFRCSASDFFPDIPDGYGLTKVDLEKVGQVDDRAKEWATKLFGEKRK